MPREINVVSETVEASAQEVYEFARQRENLHRWVRAWHRPTSSWRATTGWLTHRWAASLPMKAMTLL